MESFYRKQLAHIHDTYYGDIARHAAEEILKKVNHKVDRKVIDLGCGSGILASILSENGMTVTGIDISADLLDIAKRKAPEAGFVHASLFDYEIDFADIICAVGEPLNYLFDEKAGYAEITKLFKKVYEKSARNGFFLFDIITDEVEIKKISIIEKDDYTMFIETDIDVEKNILTRKMIYFTQYQQYYQKDSETHKQYLYNTGIIEEILDEVGFNYQKSNGYGGLEFRKGHLSFLCKK